MRFCLLALALCVLPMASAAILTRLRRDKSVEAIKPVTEAEFDARIKILVGENTSSLSAQQDIDTNMRLNLPFYALQITSRKSGDDDEWTFVAGSSTSFDTWPDGAYSHLLWCVQAANETMRAAMSACGPQAACDSDFVVYSTWGTTDGMNFKKDGVMLYQCLGVQTTKSKCADASKQPCKLDIVGDFYESMWPTTSSVNIIGNGTTKMAQMKSDLKAYSQLNGMSWALPSAAGMGKRNVTIHLPPHA